METEYSMGEAASDKWSRTPPSKSCWNHTLPLLSHRSIYESLRLAQWLNHIKYDNQLSAPLTTGSPLYYVWQVLHSSDHLRVTCAFRMSVDPENVSAAVRMSCLVPEAQSISPDKQSDWYSHCKTNRILGMTKDQIWLFTNIYVNQIDIRPPSLSVAYFLRGE